MQAIIIQPEIQAAAVPTTSCSLIRRFTGGNALAKQSLTTYRLRCKAVDCCETLHHLYYWLTAYEYVHLLMLSDTFQLSVNYLLIVILEQLIAMVTIRTQSQWIEPIKRGMKQTLCGHIVKIYVALEVLQQAPMEAILIALQPTLQGVIRHITICNHTLLFIGGSVLVS